MTMTADEIKLRERERESSSRYRERKRGTESENPQSGFVRKKNFELDGSVEQNVRS